MKTKSNSTKQRYTDATWRGSRRANTFLLQMAQADAERGERIKCIREEKLHLTQEAMAEKVGITLRAYQEWEAGGGIKWPNAQKLAKIGGVKADWIMGGDQGPTPDLSSATQLDRMEGELAAIRVELGTLAAQAAETQRLVQRLVDTEGGTTRSQRAK